MKSQTSAFELSCVIRELQDLMSAKVEKIYLNEKDLLIVLHVPSTGKRFLRINVPDFAYIASYRGTFPEKPGGFCMFLRKYLSNARLREVNQLGFERIAEFVFERKEGKYRLIAEFFSTGNLILCTDEHIIMNPLENQKWKDRTVRGRVEYKYPQKKYNFLLLKEEELSVLLKESNRDSVVKTLAIDLGLGGTYSEELLFRAGIDKARKVLKPEEISALFSEMKKLRTEKVKGTVIGKEIVPIELRSMGDDHGKGRASFKTFNEALDSVLSEAKEKEEAAVVEVKEKEHKTKVEKILASQLEDIKRLEQEADVNQKKGELIYTNYRLVSEILAELSKAKKKYTLKEMKEKLKGHRIVKDINNEEVVIQLD